MPRRPREPEPLQQRKGLQQKKPINKKRPGGPRRGQATPDETKAIRDALYARSGGLCELNLSPKCIKGVLPFTGVTPWDHGHLVHRPEKGKRMWGTRLEDSFWGCHHCHLDYLHNAKGKPCPPKPRS